MKSKKEKAENAITAAAEAKEAAKAAAKASAELEEAGKVAAKEAAEAPAEEVVVDEAPTAEEEKKDEKA